ncbi:hypothetical protein [Gimesia maris]|jgi:hypothetical protein|uniref:Uncharacterized protein n=1 Tax=Gimesia maris TaxID=122 RepID=A0ABX5YLB5_9PLAN|nr:hypothetical protein [Gimesia maris]EDL57020.1 hypothetical protein PM8797T_00704 [Gimesia maris DSM 8797]QDT78890.1 hypothetical protein Mal35_23410 [Gimesia maris]QEG16400.1 hypothetical protein GmarT_22630 [Gimesia maris]|tara:strand:- start:11653 stop:11823 length:171 start_codon:yes stop_codon:yes gene_type:complete
MNDPQTSQELPYTETEIETMATEDASAGKFLTVLMVCTFSYTVIVGTYVIFWSLKN